MPITRGTLAFIGPAQAPALKALIYVRVVRTSADLATVHAVGPDVDSDSEFSIPLDKLRHRVVDDSESELWPGSYVGLPVAFAHPSGSHIDEWAYGVVTGYHVAESLASLRVRYGTETTTIPLDPLRLIKLDLLNYAIQVGAGVNIAIVNALELLDQQNKVIAAYKSKRATLPKTIANMLSVPLAPNERVPLLRPHDLTVVSVRRQHIIDCTTGSRKRNASDVYTDPQVSSSPPSSSDTRQVPKHQRDEPYSPASSARSFRTAIENDDNGADADSLLFGTDEDDVEDIKRQNRPLTKRTGRWRQPKQSRA